MMSALRSNAWRLTFLPLLLAASLLLPTLHLHPVHDHDHGGHGHQYAVIHADFFPVSVQDHRHAEQKDFALGDSNPSPVPQSSLSVAFSRVETLRSLEKSPDFLLVALAAASAPLRLLTQVLKQDHPPPLRQIILSPNTPRSPPRLA